MTTTAQNIIPSNPKDLEAILEEIKNADAFLIRIESARHSIKEIVDSVHEEYKLDKKLIRQMISTYHKQNYTAVELQQNDFQEAYGKIVKP